MLSRSESLRRASVLLEMDWAAGFLPLHEPNRVEEIPENGRVAGARGLESRAGASGLRGVKFGCTGFECQVPYRDRLHPVPLPLRGRFSFTGTRSGGWIVRGGDHGRSGHLKEATSEVP